MDRPSPPTFALKKLDECNCTILTKKCRKIRLPCGSPCFIRRRKNVNHSNEIKVTPLNEQFLTRVQKYSAIEVVCLIEHG